MKNMDSFMISDDIYQESSSLDSYKISDEIYEETMKLSEVELRQEMMSTYHFSGRFWIWKLETESYRHKWEEMFEANEMRIEALGLVDILSYRSQIELQNVYWKLHHNSSDSYKVSLECFRFAHSLKKGDVIIVCGEETEIIAWGMVEGTYLYSPERKQGKHYRKVTWTKMDMPFDFTNMRERLYQIPEEETNQLLEVLVDKVFQCSDKLISEYHVFGCESDNNFLWPERPPKRLVIEESQISDDADSTIEKGNNIKKEKILQIVDSLQNVFYRLNQSIQVLANARQLC